jgi:metal-responsive CopG/Arc/MetJ family transcriptional regulator
MDVLNIKIEKGIIRDIDKSLRKYRYSTRSEFVRDAIRQKLTDLEKEELMRAVAKVRGSSKHKTSDTQVHETRERLIKKLEKQFI